MTLIAGKPQPSAWEFRKNGAADKIHGFDDGETINGEDPHAYAEWPQPKVTGDLSYLEHLPADIY